MSTTHSPPWRLVRFPIVLLALVAVANRGAAEEFEGFTEPFQTLALSAAEGGLVAELVVREGDRVQAGEVVGRLDQRDLVASLEIARQAKTADAELRTTRAEVAHRRLRYERLLALRADGSATQEEVDFAKLDLETAEGRELGARESRLVRELEYERVLAQIERRNVRSPIEGVVTRIHTEVGEYAQPTNPIVVTVVQLDPLLVVLPVSTDVAARLRKGTEVPVAVGASGRIVRSRIDSVSAVIDAESGSVRVKLRIPNGDGSIRSGEPCRVDFAR